MKISVFNRNVYVTSDIHNDADGIENRIFHVHTYRCGHATEKNPFAMKKNWI